MIVTTAGLASSATRVRTTIRTPHTHKKNNSVTLSNCNLSILFWFCFFLPACSEGFFGKNCSFHCKCKNGASCDPVTGSCRCPPGVSGDLCQDGELSACLFRDGIFPLYLSVCCTLFVVPRLSEGFLREAVQQEVQLCQQRTLPSDVRRLPL